MKKLLLCCLALVLLGACSTRVNNSPGLQAYKDGDYTLAHRMLYPAFEAGDNQAGYGLGMMYLDANGVERDLVTAEAYLLAAAMAGDPRAIKGLRTLYREHPACETDEDLGRMWSGLWGQRNFIYGTTEIFSLDTKLQRKFAEIYGEPCGDRPARHDVSQQWYAWAQTPKRTIIPIYD